MDTIYSYSVWDATNKEMSLETYKNNVLLIVNTATGCGFTPQYEQLEKMYQTYHSQGLEIIDIPCNQFGEQAPGTQEEITEFCQLFYHTTFPQMRKSDVNGEHALPLYTFLKSQDTEGEVKRSLSSKVIKNVLKLKNKGASQQDIQWNFTKFVVDRKGKVVARFEPGDSMEELERLVASLVQER